MESINYSYGLVFGLFIFFVMGAFYGVKSTDVGGIRLLVLSLAANLMSFTIFGVVFTLVWLVAMAAGYDLSIPAFHWALLQMVAAGVGGFFLGYIAGKVIRPDHRTVH